MDMLPTCLWHMFLWPYVAHVDVINQPASLSLHVYLSLLSTVATYLPTYLSPIQHRNEINENERTNERTTKGVGPNHGTHISKTRENRADGLAGWSDI